MREENFQRLKQQLAKAHDWQRHVLDHFLTRKPTARNPNTVFDERMTRGQRIADRISHYGGSWSFILTFLAGLSLWMLYNIKAGKAFDPFPFILLNLVLSCLAALQAPVIMMSQNRQSAKDRMDAQHDYEVNLKTELEVFGLHTKLDELREQRLSEMLQAIQQQTAILERIEARLAEKTG